MLHFIGSCLKKSTSDSRRVNGAEAPVSFFNGQHPEEVQPGALRPLPLVLKKEGAQDDGDDENGDDDEDDDDDDETYDDSGDDDDDDDDDEDDEVRTECWFVGCRDARFLKKCFRLVEKCQRNQCREPLSF